jgi:hypothetical protein
MIFMLSMWHGFNFDQTIKNVPRNHIQETIDKFHTNLAVDLILCFPGGSGY